MAAAAALLAGSAAADPIPIPPLPPPPVTVPPLPVPVPPPPPPPTAPVPVPAVPPAPTPAPVQTATSSLSQSAGSALGATSSGSVAASSPSSVTGSSYTAGQSGGGGSSASSSPAAARGARVDHFHSSRPWIGTTGSKRRRTTTLTFVVQHPGRVVFTVNQVSPACVGMGHFIVAAHSGLNRVRFGGVLHRRRLGPGTYRISIRTAAGQVVRRVTLVVVDGAAPSRDELEALRASNTCHGVTTSGSASTTSTSLTGATAPPLGPQKLPQPHTAVAGIAPPHGPNLHSGVLASTVEKTARAIAPVLVALLALSIVLLGLASLPREAVPGPRVHDALARHRLELVTLGTAALVAVALAFFLT